MVIRQSRPHFTTIYTYISCYVLLNKKLTLANTLILRLSYLKRVKEREREREHDLEIMILASHLVLP